MKTVEEIADELLRKSEELTKDEFKVKLVRSLGKARNEGVELAAQDLDLLAEISKEYVLEFVAERIRREVKRDY